MWACWVVTECGLCAGSRELRVIIVRAGRGHQCAWRSCLEAGCGRRSVAVFLWLTPGVTDSTESYQAQRARRLVARAPGCSGTVLEAGLITVTGDVWVEQAVGCVWGIGRGVVTIAWLGRSSNSTRLVW